MTATQKELQQKFDANKLKIKKLTEEIQKLEDQKAELWAERLKIYTEMEDTGLDMCNGIIFDILEKEEMRKVE